MSEQNPHETERLNSIGGLQRFSAIKSNVIDDDYGWLVSYEDHRRIVDSQALEIERLKVLVAGLHAHIDEAQAVK